MSDDQNTEHWLVRATTIAWLWRISIVILALTVLAQFVFPMKGYFGIDGWMGFGALYGFVACLAMVLVAKALGLVLKRQENYYKDLQDKDGKSDD
ncbi:MAG TPA: hypothetical protein DCW52_07020 [Gammaproteobacteria bacterium]|jgi:hypothetical protein|nr:hypothetical protein [Gammaproteobacteria bacterium]